MYESEKSELEVTVQLNGWIEQTCCICIKIHPANTMFQKLIFLYLRDDGEWGCQRCRKKCNMTLLILVFLLKRLEIGNSFIFLCEKVRIFVPFP